MSEDEPQEGADDEEGQDEKQDKQSADFKEEAAGDDDKEEDWVQIVKGGKKKASNKETAKYKLHPDDYQDTKVLERKEIHQGAQGIALISPQDLLGIFREGWIRGYQPAKPLTLYVVPGGARSRPFGEKTLGG